MEPRSGTHQIHGSVYEFLRNSRLDSNNFFLNRSDRPLGTFQRNQFGFTIGGPVYIPGVYNGRNRTFVFGGYEGVRERRQQTSQATIPLRLQPACAIHSGEFRPHPARTSLSRNSQP